MVSMMRRCLWVGLVALALACLLAAGVSAEGVGERTITRDVDPVIVPGASVPEFLGVRADALWVYALRGGALAQIPHQVDHITTQGEYSPVVAGYLNPQDEIVLMASDLGDRVAPAEIAGSLPISPTWYEIEVTDSLSPTLKGWAYLVGSATLTRTFTETYASYDVGTRRFSTPRYVLGFAPNHPGFEYLELNGSGVDILDRTKIRLSTFLGPRDEESLGPETVALIKNGPVRVIAGVGNVVAYRDTIELEIEYKGLSGVTLARLSTDFSSAVVTSTFYNANTPLGVTVDGKPDPVALVPLSRWWQVSGRTGTLLQFVDTSRVGGFVSNYYKDDDTLNLADKGDNRSYGDTGVQVAQPNRDVVFASAYVMLPPWQPNVGARYAAERANPLAIMATAQMHTPSYGLYLPLLVTTGT